MVKLSAFTLVEMLLIIAIMGVIVGLSAPVVRLSQISNNLDLAALTTTQAIKRAQLLSMAVAEDSNWGLNAGTSSLIIFKGANFATRDINFDEVWDMPSGTSVTSTASIVFNKTRGDCITPGQLFVSSVNNATKILVINSKGTVEY
ncbi:hypothetical protein COT94_02335 [Candidatus Falkowbacteria bacterium CG10_big_fil_rev_8_21_14_0_10_37_14]|uniref:General secretion pathway GspH domain-containing protein n=1 Tax=Candidatus Falkowbacteria bacterium CG10_big_fil_rev_8_21_14_0_10_37_14 TaxID=1974561 RepID=A0A2M6WTG1_9BACT|nr:hypothetical protein [Candidatus Falkowbacteria bacterium]PIT96078.1 MAG: hypothetical protein COT94_02335 [Candidatus Falkowbacteria bacterium CG10_big_fil_rev_8_21_14_0_10_37_14]